jgi:hypothetical protein
MMNVQLRMFYREFILALLFVCSCCRSAEIFSGGFEEGSASPSGGWVYKVSGTTQAVYIQDGIAGDRVHTGTRAVSLVNPEGNVERWYVLNAQSPAITAGQTYEFTIWVKTENMDLAATYIEMDWLDSSDARISYDTSALVTTAGDWSRLTFSATAPAGAVKLRPILMVDGTAGSNAVVTFDDYVITQVEPSLKLLVVTGN